jgi:transposase InsO family protein
MPFLPDADGKKRRTFLLIILDDYSRLIVGARIFFTDTAVNFQAVLKSSVATYGVPHKLIVDNGAPYICKQTSFICADIGALIRRAPPRDAKYKGKIERVIKNVKEIWLYGLDMSHVQTLDDFNRLLAKYIREYNLNKHSSTGVTPMNRFLSTRDRIKAPPSREWLDEKFMHRLVRNVAGDSTLRLDGQQWDAPMQFIGNNVEVRYLPGREAYILAGGERYELRRTNKQENARTRRKNTASINYSIEGGDSDV